MGYRENSGHNVRIDLVYSRKPKEHYMVRQDDRLIVIYLTVVYNKAVGSGKARESESK